MVNNISDRHLVHNYAISLSIAHIL